MMRSCDNAKPTAGFSVLEALITLSVLALTIVMLSGQTPKPSIELRFSSLIGELKKEVATHRARAITTQQPTRYKIDQKTCDGEPVSVTFFPDGTGSTGEICLAIDDAQRILIVHTFTGHIQEAPTP